MCSMTVRDLHSVCMETGNHTNKMLLAALCTCGWRNHLHHLCKMLCIPQVSTGWHRQVSSTILFLNSASFDILLSSHFILFTSPSQASPQKIQSPRTSQNTLSVTVKYFGFLMPVLSTWRTVQQSVSCKPYSIWPTVPRHSAEVTVMMGGSRALL